jgi:hypothetical protein
MVPSFDGEFQTPPASAVRQLSEVFARTAWFAWKVPNFQASQPSRRLAAARAAASAVMGDVFD